MAIEIVHGDCRELLATLEPGSVSAVVTDPPYEIGFMSSDWDRSGIAYDVAMWGLVLRALKPGGHMLAFGGTRTYHRMACAIEDAGFEIRDCLQYLHGSGFPKGLNIGKAIDKQAGAERPVVGSYVIGGNAGTSTAEKGGTYAVGAETSAPVEVPITAAATDEAKRWNGWMTGLKPANEPIVLCRKPLDGTIVQNVLKHGVGGINVDGCRIGSGKQVPSSMPTGRKDGLSFDRDKPGRQIGEGQNPNIGRHPANVIMDPEAGAILDAQAGDRPGMNGGGQHAADYGGGMFGGMDSAPKRPADNGGPSRFFYSAKTSRKEREHGLVTPADGGRANTHPTVKPIALMRWLVRLISPPGGLVLDPFAGSCTTGIACKLEGLDMLGFELLAEHVELGRARVAAWERDEQTTLKL